MAREGKMSIKSARLKYMNGKEETIKIKSIKFIHLAWHLCVIAGSVAHFVGIYFYVLPLSV